MEVARKPRQGTSCCASGSSGPLAQPRRRGARAAARAAAGGGARRAATGLVAARRDRRAATSSSARSLLQLKTRARQRRRAARARDRHGDGARPLPRLRVATCSSNAALFAALGYATGQAVARARRVPRADARARASTSTSSGSTAASAASRARRCPRRPGSPGVLARVYDVVYAPQDRLVEGSSSGGSAERRLGEARLPRPRDARGARELRPVDAARGARRLPRGRPRRRPTCGSSLGCASRSSPASRSGASSPAARRVNNRTQERRCEQGWSRDERNVVELRHAPAAGRERGRRRDISPRGLARATSATRRDLRRRSGWTSTRPARGRRRSGSCGRSTTRPPATRATRSS